MRFSCIFIRYVPPLFFGYTLLYKVYIIKKEPLRCRGFPFCYFFSLAHYGNNVIYITLFLKV
ncbi:hypothetical protein SUBVAR_06383 [Subdoligranulum variabile DSM 15176]|uniref:Uncharacterized protein n=1 Tax=Subdoligranulum variabile DSM 15176 TaxID=411471 RepID=D1PPR7_9FIRM|nr:hypothetical protein SUBVAR_06383 [Subdoligranulum variabile DSM 15176]